MVLRWLQCWGFWTWTALPGIPGQHLVHCWYSQNSNNPLECKNICSVFGKNFPSLSVTLDNQNNLRLVCLTIRKKELYLFEIFGKIKFSIEKKRFVCMIQWFTLLLLTLAVAATMPCKKSFKHNKTQWLKTFVSCSWVGGLLGSCLCQLSLAALGSLGPGLLFMSPQFPQSSTFPGQYHLTVGHQRAKGRLNGANTFKAFTGIISAHIPLAKVKSQGQVWSVGQRNTPPQEGGGGERIFAE